MIETRRLKMRRIVESDWRAIRGIWEDQKRSRYARYDKPNDTADEAVRGRIARWGAFSESAEHMFFAVCREETVIGYVSIHRRSEGFEVGYCFHSAYHGKGYARESVSALIEAVSGGKAARFTAGTALENEPSVRLLKALGFRKIGEEKVSFYRDETGADIVFDGGVFELWKNSPGSETAE